MFDSLGLTVVLALAVLATWLAMRARRANNRLVKWVGLGLSSLLAVACTLVIGVVLVGFYRINFPPHRPATHGHQGGRYAGPGGAGRAIRCVMRRVSFA